MSTENFKRIYFVRHGESTNNVRRKDQSNLDLLVDSPLTKNGIKQSKTIGKRLKKVKIDKIFSSSYKRAIQTAEEIKKKTKIDYEVIEFVHERVSKNKLVHFSNLYNLSAEEGEDFKSIIKRIKDTIEFIENQPEENILIVSHGMFMRIFLAYVILGDDITQELAEKFLRKVTQKNTSITKFCIIDGQWRLGYWADEEHLG